MKADANDSRLGSLVLVRAHPPGQYTAQVVGLPEILATAGTREEALEQVRELLNVLLASGQLVAIDLPAAYPGQAPAVRRDADDPLEKEFVEELARSRQEDLERTLREYDGECPNSSSTPMGQSRVTRHG